MVTQDGEGPEEGPEERVWMITIRNNPQRPFAWPICSLHGPLTAWPHSSLTKSLLIRVLR